MKRRDFLMALGLAGPVVLDGFRSQAAIHGGPRVMRRGGPRVMRRQPGLGVALAGLGNYSTYQLAPALLKTSQCHLAGIVTGTPYKRTVWMEKYHLPAGNVYDYAGFDAIADNPAIDIVYVVLPVALHKDLVIRAAKAGKHVICEKPMAVSSRDCAEMIDACKAAHVSLSIGYRLHFEPYTNEIYRLAHERVLGEVQSITARNGFVFQEGPDNWRVKKSLAGGGGLMDMGIYCIHACRCIAGRQPLSVMAVEEKLKPDLFAEVDETIRWEMDFGDNLRAHCVSSYNGNYNELHADASRGWSELSQAFRYGGMAGGCSRGPFTYDRYVNQQAAQLDGIAASILEKRQSPVPGEMGLADMKVVEAIYRSLASGRREEV